MISPRYKKAITLLVFVFALSFAFYFAFSQVSRADFSTDHSECRSGVCIVVPGVSGNSTCSDDSDCANRVQAHLACENNTCVRISGPGIQTCGGDADCAGTTVSPHANPSPSSGGSSNGLPGIDLTIQGIFNIIYGFACWLWSIAMVLLVIFIILAGLRFMYAGDDTTKATAAKTNFKYVILGAIVVMGTFVIISTVAYNIGVNISFIPFDCSGINTSSGPTGSGNTHDYQGKPGDQCYASQSDCQAADETQCVECTTNQACVDGADCTGSSGSSACTVDSNCPAGQVCSGDAQSGGGVCVPGGNSRPSYQDDSLRCYNSLAGCKANGIGCTQCNSSCIDGSECTASGPTPTPTPTPNQFLNCIGGTCQYESGLSSNQQGCVSENQSCEGQ